MKIILLSSRFESLIPTFENMFIWGIEMYVWHAFIYFIKKARGLSSQAWIGATCVKLFESLLVLPLICSFVRWSIVRILWRKFVPHCLKVHVQLSSMALIFLGIRYNKREKNLFLLAPRVFYNQTETEVFEVSQLRKSLLLVFRFRFLLVSVACLLFFCSA